MPPSSSIPALGFHSDNPGYIIYVGEKCTSGFLGLFEQCVSEAYYTLDSFATPAKLFMSNLGQCIWAQGAKEFRSTSPYAIVCEEIYGENKDGMRVIRSEDFFQTREVVKFGDGENTMALGIGAANKFLIAAVVTTHN